MLLSLKGVGQTIKNIGNAWPNINCGSASVEVNIGALNLSNIKYFLLVGSTDGSNWNNPGTGIVITTNTANAFVSETVNSNTNSWSE